MNLKPNKVGSILGYLGLCLELPIIIIIIVVVIITTIIIIIIPKFWAIIGFIQKELKTKHWWALSQIQDGPQSCELIKI